MNTRKYTKRQRAEQQAHTRERIVEATMALHEELGPRNTTISAIAKRAGVQRLTVYRHFEDDSAIFQACSSRWLELNPPPDPAGWQQITSAAARTTAALHAMYRYYRKTASMWHGIYRDEAEVTALQQPMNKFRSYQIGIRNNLVAAWQAKGKTRKTVMALLGHALQFSTWQSFDGQMLTDKQTAELITHCLSVTVKKK